MNVANDAPQMDYVKYFTEQLPRDLAAMAALRDELATRQGALSAAEDTLKLKADAQAALAAAKAEAAQLVVDAKAKNDEAKVKNDAAKAREAAVLKLQQEFDVKSAAALAELTAAKAQIAAREQALAEAQLLCNDKLAALENDRAVLNARVKAFQDKVAALSA